MIINITLSFDRPLDRDNRSLDLHLYSRLYNVFVCLLVWSPIKRSSQPKNRQFAPPSFSRSANRTTDITRESTRPAGRLHQCYTRVVIPMNTEYFLYSLVIYTDGRRTLPVNPLTLSLYYSNPYFHQVLYLRIFYPYCKIYCIYPICLLSNIFVVGYIYCTNSKTHVVDQLVVI